MKMKRMICLLLAAMLLLVGCSKKSGGDTAKDAAGEGDSNVAVFNEADYTVTGECGEGVKWGFNEESGELGIGGEGAMNVIPEVSDDPIAATEESGMPWSGKEIKVVTVYSGVTAISAEAFYGINTLEVVNLPETVTEIGARAFASCAGLREINVSSDNPNYMSAGGALFTKDAKTLLQYPVGLGQTNYDIPEGVEIIGEMAFANCGDTLSVVSVPASVTQIEKGAFLFCRALTDVIYAGSEAQWKSVKVAGDNDLLGFATFSFAG